MTRNKKKKHDKILMLAKSKLNSIETLISQALIDLDINHEEFIRILKEKDKYEKMKENLRGKNEEYKIMKLSSIKSKIKKNSEILLNILDVIKKNLFFSFVYIKLINILYVIKKKKNFFSCSYIKVKYY